MEAEAEIGVELFSAIERDDESAVKELIEKKGIPLTCLNDDDQTVAHVAALEGHLNILKYLVEKDPSVLTPVDFHGESVIFLAIQGGHFDVVKYLVETCGVDICQRQGKCFGNTCLHKAAEEGKLQILKYFLEERNADVNIKNTLEQTPLTLAAESKHLDVFKYLVEERKANVTTIDYRKYNVLFTAVNSNDLELLKYVLDERKVEFDINFKDESYITLVHRAAIQDRFDIIKYLVGEKHADVNIPDKWGKTPLHSAARWNYFATCKYLIEKGADLQTKDDRGKLPIDEASEQHLIDLMKNASLKRNRRSVPKSVPLVPVSFLSEKYFPAPPKIGDRNPGIERANPNSHPVYSSHVQNFLLIAGTMLGRYFKHQLNIGKLFMVSDNIDRDRFVQNAVRILPHFAMTPEN